MSNTIGISCNVIRSKREGGSEGVREGVREGGSEGVGERGRE